MSSGFSEGNNLSLEVRKFNIDHNKASYLIIGRFFRTVPLIKEIIGNTRSIVITFDKTRSYNQDTCQVTDNFDLTDLRTYINSIKRNNEKGINREHTYIVFDDCFYDDSWQSNKALIELLNDRNNIFNISVVIALSYPYRVSRSILNSIDYTIVLYEPQHRNIQVLYQHQFNFIDSYYLFHDIFVSICRDRDNCVVIMNGEIEGELIERKSIEKCLRWYDLPQQQQGYLYVEKKI